MTKELNDWCEKIGLMIKDQRGYTPEEFADMFRELLNLMNEPWYAGIPEDKDEISS